MADKTLSTAAQKMTSTGEFTIENVRVLPGRFRNFSGLEGEYNAEGDRNFCIAIDDPDMVEQMQRDGWKIDFLKPREEGDEPQAFLRVTVKYRNRFGKKTTPPLVAMLTSKGRLDLTEEEIEVLDWVDIESADLTIRQYHWSMKNGKSGVKAYLKEIWVRIEESYLQQKYADVEYAEIAPQRERLALPAGDETGDMDIHDAEILEDEG